VEIVNRVRNLVVRIARVGIVPSDSEDERLRKVVVTSGALLIATLAPAWVLTYGLLGLWLSAAIPFSYQILVVLSILLFVRTRNFRVFYLTQFTLILVLPMLLQWTLGGFVASSGVILWSFIAPVGALLCLGPRKSLTWFIAFALAVLVSATLDTTLARDAPEIPSVVRVVFFALNFTAVTATSFVLLNYFVRSRDEARAALHAANEELITEQERSERLLLNIMPQSIADRLKSGESVIADRVPEATVLFADIIGFTPLSSRISPENLVSMLNDLFSEFDQLADQFGLEKIKTIGDSYMLVGGLPEPRPDHTETVADMALAMPDIVARCAQRIGQSIDLRIGIDTGPVVAGVIGRRKFSYDVWGDTVNTASRMASYGFAGSIQVTEAVRARLSPAYRFERRGLQNIKGKGEMRTFFLVGRSIDADESTPPPPVTGERLPEPSSGVAASERRPPTP
jgi:adenylate cyclase